MTDVDIYQAAQRKPGICHDFRITYFESLNHL